MIYGLKSKIKLRVQIRNNLGSTRKKFKLIQISE